MPAAATKIFRWCAFPSLRRRGGSATKKMPRSLLSGRDGVVAYEPCSKRISKRFGVSDHPGASRHPSFARATLQGGECRTQKLRQKNKNLPARRFLFFCRTV